MTFPAPAAVPPIVAPVTPTIPTCIPTSLGMPTVPDASVPMRFPWMTAPAAVACIPAVPSLPEMRLRSPGVVPPTMCALAMPITFGRALEPVGSIPMKFPRMLRVEVKVWFRIAASQRLTTRP